MWTNVFRIGELQTISWFQFLPLEPDPTTLSDKSAKSDTANHAIISSHLQLQNELGLYSTWTNSFVGPWDPSQGAHNPDEKIKLWLFIPGRNSSLTESAQSAVSKLRVVGSGVWISPGDSEEISLALSQALRNTLERAMKGFSYVRFGDVFAKCSGSGQSERSLRRPQKTVEFVFSATEEAIYVHVIVSAKYVRTLCGDDIEKILMHSPHSSSDGLPVIVAPNGMLGRLTGCCPSELVKQVYTSKIRASSGSTSGAPYVNQSPGCQMRGQSFYVEIALGPLEKSNNDGPNNNNFPILEKTFIFPPERVLIPMMHRAFSRFSTKRFWIQNGTDTSLSESWPFWNFSGSSFVEHCLAVGTTCHIESSRNSSCLRLKRHYRNNKKSSGGGNNHNNNNNSASSSMSSVSSTSSEDDADVDSTASKQNPNHQGVKRSHRESGIVKSGKNNAVRNHFIDPSDNNRGPLIEDEICGIDLHTVFSEIGDFREFFAIDLSFLCLGDPPGTAESQAMVISSTDLGDTTTSTSPPVIQQLESPVSMPSLPTLRPPVPVISNIHQPVNNPITTQSLIPFSRQNVQLSKAEAMLTFAPEYAAIDFTETLISPFRNPYKPSSKKMETSSSSSNNSYVYNSAPPPSRADSADDKGEASSKLYTLVQSHKSQPTKSTTVVNNNNNNNNNGENNNSVENSIISGITSTSTTKKNESGTIVGASNLLVPCKLSLANDIDCIIHQAAMCRARHSLLSSKTKQVQQVQQQQTLINVKKENIPVRIGGGADMVDTDFLDRTGPVPQVGVWRSISSISGQKQIKQCDEGVIANLSTRNPLMDFLVGLGLLVQNSASFVDTSLDTGDGEGPFAWIALEEQKLRGFVCEPDLAHAGCGGLLATCHSLDLAGVDLVNPLSADVSVPAVMSVLQTDIKQAMKSAFGNSDGPLPLTDWCKGRSGAHTGDIGSFADPFSFLSEASSRGDSLSPPQSTSNSSTHREGQRRSNQESSNSEQEHDNKGYLKSKPTLAVLPTPSILVGYQDDWLKAPVNCIQLWEKAPLEPYALPKPVSYYAICPDIELLTTAAIDFFQQLGTVYEICRLGTHTPQPTMTQLETPSSKPSSSGLILVEAPQQIKTVKSHLTSVNSISEYFLSVSKNWTVKSFINSLTKALKNLKLSSNCPQNQKESNNGGSPSTVIYVICPFPEPSSILQTLVESSVAIGTTVLTTSEKDKKYRLHDQVSSSLNFNSNTGEDSLLSSPNITMLSGFNHSKLVLQIISIDSLLRLNTPSLNELSLLKDIAFTVYTKARRVASKPVHDPVHAISSFPGTRPPQMMHHSSHMPGLWKDCLVPRALNARDSDFDASYSTSSGSTWQAIQQRNISISDPYSFEDKKYLFEPLFILAEPGSAAEQSGSGAVSEAEGDSTEPASAGSLHCCYGWTEDWKWFVCVWTDSRGELLDNFVSPFGGVSGRQDTKALQGLFAQVLQQACQIVLGTGGNHSDNASPAKPRDIVIARLGGFFELECQEWQKAIYSIGGNEVRKWPIQMRRASPDGSNPNNGQDSNSNSNSNSFISERNISSLPNPLYSAKSSFIKSGAGTKKQIMDSNSSRMGSGSALHFIQSITLVTVCVDHSLKLILHAESGTQSSTASTGTSMGSYLDGFTPVKSVGTVPASYLLILSPNLKYLSPTHLQLPTCLTSESPPLAHLLHSKGSAIPISTGYIVSRSVQPVRKDISDVVREDWPSVLSVSLIDHYGAGKKGGAKQGRGFGEVAEVHAVMETVGAELHALSWLTVSPVYGDRRTALPFHCDMVLRLRRLLHYADKELGEMGLKNEQRVLEGFS